MKKVAIFALLNLSK